MHKIIALLLLLLTSASTTAQTKASIKGVLIDSATKTHLEYATAAVVNAKDTALISYTLTDETGSFKLTGIPIDRHTKLIISHIGYNTIRQVLDLKPGEAKDFGQILITGRSLEEVVIKGERTPVVVKKDTIEFNTEAFKTRPNAVVEELLRKLPGVQVNNDGSIEVNGKSISKLLIDGKQFFGSDPKVATRNLDADMIDKIQVYDDRENDPNHKISETEVNKIINLKLKSKIKKSTLGKVQAGGGTRDRYEAGGIISNFRDTLQVSLIGMANNLNRTGFSSNELYSMGGFNRSDGSQTWDGTFGGNNWGGGIENIVSGGLNINNDYGEKLKLNLSYFHTNTSTDNTTTSYNERRISENNTMINNAKSLSERNTQRNSLNGLMEWKPDTLYRIRYQPQFNFNPERNTYSSSGNSANTLNPLLFTSSSDNLSKNINRTFSHSFNLHRRLKGENESINISHSLNLNDVTDEDFSYSNLVSFDPATRSELQDRLKDNKRRDNSADIDVDYNFQISKKFSAELSGAAKILHSSSELFSYEKDQKTGQYSQFLPSQSTELERTNLISGFTPELRYQLSKKISLRVGVNAEYQEVKNRFTENVADINKKYINFFPVVRVDMGSFNFTYNERIQLPSIDQMQPITLEYSPLYKTAGNPDLQPIHVYQVGGQYYNYNHSKQFNTSFYSGLTFYENSVISTSIINPANGATTSTYVNRDGSINGYFGANLGKQFKKSQDWQVGLDFGINGGISRTPFFLNGQEGIQNNYHLNTTQKINFNYNELMSLNAEYAINGSLNNYEKIDYKSVNTLRHTLSSEFSLRWPKRLIFDTRYSFNYNPQIGQGFPKTSHILNLAVSVLMQKKDRGQLKLSVYDLLDQNISVNRYAWENNVNTFEQLTLKQYFLLTYQYKLNIFRGK
ncbi:MAG: TonB-dependent receptor [Chitinophagaceae bacterium]|nr:MAG: TonB-dependent receptor [Chitinophagaceae bacterium]